MTISLLLLRKTNETRRNNNMAMEDSSLQAIVVNLKHRLIGIYRNKLTAVTDVKGVIRKALSAIAPSIVGQGMETIMRNIGPVGRAELLYQLPEVHIDYKIFLWQ
ncbi:hypothetical protein ElyMa_006081000 [Elysia marginata]|uniref:Uncharacterized protein n=1 Tax=Elysia marginata TaxID=1093978 RepID=A0AAV4GRU7_9GAST|nr:hypothetical protein ElyMa_006081000 [Elysia marginata]